MKRYINIFLFIIIICSLFIGCNKKDDESSTLNNSNNGNLKIAEKIEDFEYLYKIIKDNYPLLHLNNKINESDWLSNKNNFKNLIKATKTNDEFFNALNTILEKLNNSQTHMVTKDELTILKSQYDRYLYNGNDNKWLAETINDTKVLNRYFPTGSYKKPISQPKEITKTDEPNVITKDVISDSIGYISINKFVNSYNMQEDIDIIDEYLDNIKNYDALVIDLRGNNGNENIYWQKYLMPKLINSPIENPTYSFFRNGKLIKNILKSYDESLVNVPKIRDLNYADFPNLPRDIFRDFEYYIKHNNKIVPRKSINFHGRIYLLVDKTVSNAAENFAIFAKNTGFATVIGESTSGKSNTTNPIVVMLPNSGYLLSLPISLTITKEGSYIDELKLIPNYEVHTAEKKDNFSDDECIKKVLDVEGVNYKANLTVKEKEFNFNDTLNFLNNFKPENSQIYKIVFDLINTYNGTISYFDDKESLLNKVKSKYSDKEMLILTYKKPQKISIQSTAKNIPKEYRDKFNNVMLHEVDTIVIAASKESNTVELFLGDKDKSLIIDFYDNILASKVSNIIYQFNK
ncbi:S41 family peptidase [Clostridium tarantellae]|uniref:Tail specific protease domain-containing protein n=1 Tax=Clostridium tarantellae TaxID=39493 RepID=A0A6I1MQ03_9CLOT|nr:S41 family peptidase [Clostridium tarantellae]MPQ44558.1 hypothetical protein [Clostridium tarantellae]